MKGDWLYELILILMLGIIALFIAFGEPNHSTTLHPIGRPAFHVGR